MELLILSKLKWDLTAVTSYDYLDYMIHNVSQDSSPLDPKVKRDSEKLVTLCAKEEEFISTPPSLVAASALITSIEQNNLINQFGLNLNHILHSVLEASNTTMVSSKLRLNCALVLQLRSSTSVALLRFNCAPVLQSHSYASIALPYNSCV